LPAAFKLLSVL